VGRAGLSMVPCLPRVMPLTLVRWRFLRIRSWARGYERVSDLPALWEQTAEQRVEWERRHGVDNSDPV
jgi:hypothetical protein